MSILHVRRMGMDPDDEQFGAKMKVLQEDVDPSLGTVVAYE